MPGFNIQEVNDVSTCLLDGQPRGNAAYDGAPRNVEAFRKHRYLWEVFGAGSGGGTYLGMGKFSGGGAGWPLELRVLAWKTTRPAPEFDVIVIHNGSEQIGRPGKYRWNPIDITFYEAYQDQPDICQSIYDWWAKSVVDLNTSTYSKPEDYLKQCTLSMLEGAGNAVWKYNLGGCWPSKVTPSDLSYADTEIADVTVTLCYAKAVETKA